MVESVTARRYPPSPCPTAQSQSSCASATITCPNVQVRSAAARSAMVWWSGGLTAGGQFPGVQQVGDAEHLAAEITGAGGDVKHPLGAGDPPRLFAHRAHPGGPLVLPEKLSRLIEQRYVGSSPAAGLAPERGALGRFLPSGRRRPNRR
jgi:hypothetical protein